MPQANTPSAQGGMTGIDAVSTAENYRRFAQIEAAGRSSAYETLALAVADDEATLAFLEGLPPLKRQPNLLFAAARFLLGEPPDIGHFGSQRGLTVASRSQLGLPA